MATTTLKEVEQELEHFLIALDAAFPVAVVGGLAVSVRTQPRFTADLDFAVAVDSDSDAEAVVHHLLQRQYTIEATLENIQHGRLGTVRLRRKALAPIVDLLFAAAGIESEVVAAAQPLKVLGREVKVARIGHLIAMKLISRNDKLRPDDRSDLTRLARAADAAEWQIAREAIALIEQRGFARKRDLPAALAEWQALAAELE